MASNDTLVDVYQTLNNHRPYASIVKQTFREHAHSTSFDCYAVYYEIFDRSDSTLEGVKQTGSIMIQLDIMANEPAKAKNGVIAAIDALQNGKNTLINASARSGGFDAKTRLYLHSVDLLIHY